MHTDEAGREEAFVARAVPPAKIERGETPSGGDTDDVNPTSTQS